MMNTEYKTIQVELESQVLSIRLNRPQSMNAVIKLLYDELLSALKDASFNDDVKVITLTGNGRAFCAGADLKAHKEGRTAEEKRAYLAAEQDVCKAIFHHKKPVIAAVNGYAIGAGLELALNCDFIFMAESAQVGLPEVDLGTFVGGGVSWLLPRLIGLPAARQLLFGENDHQRSLEKMAEGRPLPRNRITAQHAKHLGLVMDVIPDSSLIERVDEFAKRLASKPSLSVQKMKNSIHIALEGSYEDALNRELESMIECSNSEDWQNTIN